MSLKEIYNLFLVLIFSVLMSGCFSDSLFNFKKHEAKGAFRSNVKLDVHAAVIDNTTIKLDTTKNVAIGDIVLIEDGLSSSAKKIDSLAGSIATVSNPPIEDVFEDLSIEQTYTFEEAIDQDGSSSRASVPMSSLADFNSYFKKIPIANGLLYRVDRYPVYNENGVYFFFSGEVFIEKPNINVSYNLFRKEATVIAHFGERSSAAIDLGTSNKSVVLDKDILLGNYAIPITVMGVPVCQISYAIILNIGAEGQATLKAQYSQVIQADLSMVGNLAGITPKYTFSAPDNKYFNYSVNGSGNFKTWLNFQPIVGLKILQYDIASVNGDLGVKGAGDFALAVTDGSGNMKLTLGCNLHAIAKATFLGDNALTKTFLNWNKDFNYLYDKAIGAATPVSNGDYKIISMTNRQMMDVNQSSKSDGAIIQLWSDNNSDNQIYKFERMSNGYYKITAKHSGKCLDSPGSTQQGAQIQQLTDNGSLAQRWIIEKDANGYFYIKSKLSGFYLDILDGSNGSAARIIQKPYSGGPTQRWVLMQMI